MKNGLLGDVQLMEGNVLMRHISDRKGFVSIVLVINIWGRKTRSAYSKQIQIDVGCRSYVE